MAMTNVTSVGYTVGVFPSTGGVEPVSFGGFPSGGREERNCSASIMAV